MYIYYNPLTRFKTGQSILARLEAGRYKSVHLVYTSLTHHTSLALQSQFVWKSLFLHELYSLLNIGALFAILILAEFCTYVRCSHMSDWKD